MAKLSWDKIYKDFRKTHPNYKNKVFWWCPHDFLKILIYLEDGRKITFDYQTREIVFLDETWK